MTDLPTHPISPEARQKTVDRLCAHFASDHLEATEFEHRLDLAYAAQTSSELVALEQGLPVLAPQPEDGQSPPVSAPVPVDPTRVDTTRTTPNRATMVAIMGGAERKGNWTPPRHLRVLTVMGGAGLDFRDATFATHEIEVWVCSVMGGVEIIVPPGVHVESDGIAIMGGFGTEEPGLPADPDAPLIRIRGLVMMGAVEIKERLPGETDREARKRLKAVRKAKRLGGVP